MVRVGKGIVFEEVEEISSANLVEVIIKINILFS